MDTYRNDRDYPFCPGCGHGLILNALDKALISLQLDPHRVVIVSDIGCQGLGDQYFVTNTFHGLHGRSITYATGIKLVDPDLHVVVLIGDGGTGIGGAHLLSAARRNIGMTVLVFNNFNFGMTGGEHSVTTPLGGITATTRDGNLERPLDLCATVAVNGAGFVWRGTAFDKDLSDIVAQAMQSNSFALLDIWELCTAYYVPNNTFSRRMLEETRTALQMPVGLISRQTRPEYSRALSEARSLSAAKPSFSTPTFAHQFASSLDRQYQLVIAGSAGGKVRSVARIVAEAAVLSGLWVTQRDSYPVTVKSGYSVSELCLSPSEILFAGSSRPDTLIVVTDDGYAAATPHLARLTADSQLFVTPEYAGLITQARKTVIEVDAASSAGRKERTLLMVGAALRQLELFPIEACEEAIRLGQRAPFAETNTAVLRESQQLVCRDTRVV